MSTYHTAQICKNGHVITSCADKHIDSREFFCSDCGAETIMNCPSCNKPIRGLENSEYSYLFDYHIPSYCCYCGKPYPWTESTIESARLLINEDENLNTTEKQQFSESISDLIVESPTHKTQLAAVRFKKFLAKSASSTAEGLKDIFVDVASETIKKSLGL